MREIENKQYEILGSNQRAVRIMRHETTIIPVLYSVHGTAPKMLSKRLKVIGIENAEKQYHPIFCKNPKVASWDLRSLVTNTKGKISAY